MDARRFRCWSFTSAIIAGALFCAVAAVALALTAMSASASHQAPKNGCTSTTPQRGEVELPPLDLGEIASPFLFFRTWWEIESVNPLEGSGVDQMSVEYFNGRAWVPADILNPTPQDEIPPGSPDIPLANTFEGEGSQLQTPPDWESRGVFLGDAAEIDATNVRLRFVFDSGDRNYNGFRGWAIDDVRVDSLTFTDGPKVAGADSSDVSASAVPDLEDFEGGVLPAGWTATGFWQVQADPQDVQIAPGIDPELVTLSSEDDGHLPADDNEGDRHVLWFGEAATGTYCGADFATEPQPGSPPDPPPARPLPPAGVEAPQEPGPQEPGGPFPPGIITGATIDDLPNPEPYQTANVERLSGEVFVQLPPSAGASIRQARGAPPGFIPLRQAAQLPFGSVVETSRGKVLLESTSANSNRLTQRAQFFRGRFQMVQKRVRGGNINRPVTEMIIKGGGFRSGCPSRRASAADGGVRANGSRRQRARRRGRVVRRLWGRGTGRFRTRGRYSSATVRGTTWVVQDHCEGTFTRLPRRPRDSRVNVWDRLQRRTVILRAGQSHFAGRRSALLK